jgi:hypothetical protein
MTILMSLAAYAGSIYGMKFKGIYHKIISFGLAISMMLSWAGIRELSTISWFILAFLAILTSIYGIIVRSLYFTERASISVIGFLVLSVTIFTFQHYKGINILRACLLIPVVFYLISFKNRVVTKELSFMFFWILLSIIQLLKLADLHTIGFS